MSVNRYLRRADRKRNEEEKKMRANESRDWNFNLIRFKEKDEIPLEKKRSQSKHRIYGVRTGQLEAKENEVGALRQRRAHWVERLWNRRVEYWAIRSSVCSITRTAHSFACSALLASLARSAALIRSLARSLSHSGAHGKATYVYEFNASISYSFNPLCATAEKK